MGAVEIVYNVISFVIAVGIVVAFTVYTRRALDELKRAEGSGDPSEPGGLVEIGKFPPLQSSMTSSSPSFDV